MNFANIRNNEIIDMNSKYLDTDIIRVEVSDEIYQAYLEDRNRVIYLEGEVILNPNYEAEQELKERKRIAKLYLTGADVERGIYQAKGMDFDDIMAFVMANPPVGLDVKALKIELKANHFYRGNPYVNAVGALLGFTSEQLDKFFQTNDYTCILPAEEPEEPVDDGVTEYDIPEGVEDENTTDTSI